MTRTRLRSPKDTQAQAYAIIAVKRLLQYEIIRGSIKEATSAIKAEMKVLFDELTEEEAERKSIRILQGQDR
jgi:hypothetical protein